MLVESIAARILRLHVTTRRRLVNDMTDAQANDTQANDTEKGIGVLGAASIGVGGMVGGGIFAVLGTATGLARGGTPVAFLIAGTIALLTAYSYARLSATLPHAGGTVLFIDQAFGVDLWTGITNLILYLSYLVTIGLYANAFAGYAITFFQTDAAWLKHVLISVAILLPTALNLMSPTLVSRFETWIVVFKLMLLTVVVCAGFGSVDPAAFELSEWSPPMTLVAGGMVIFVAYEGFELIANAGDDMQNPTVTMPRAYFLAVGSVVVLYFLVAIVTVGSLSFADIAKSKDYALAAAAQPSLGHFGFVLVSVSAVLATLSAINATIYGNARLGYLLAKDGELPHVIERKAWNRPVGGVLVTAVASLVLANSVDLESIAMMASFGFLFIFAVVNAACFRMAKRAKANRLICGVSTLTTAAALITLTVHAWNTDRTAVTYIAGMFVIAVGFELTYPKLIGRPLSLTVKAAGDSGSNA